MNGRDVHYWIELIFRRRRTVLEVASVVFGLVVVGTLAWPPSYEATARILIQDNRAQLLVSPGLQENSPQNPALVNFKGMGYFPIDPKWRFDAKFEPYSPPKIIPIAVETTSASST